MLLQCTDCSRFYPASEEEKVDQHEFLFVGNSRGVFCKILKDLLPSHFDLAIYGKDWQKNIVKGKRIRNEQLYRYYSATDILLSEHWDNVRKKGFISNRIYDGFACGAFIITDVVKGIELFKDYLQIYRNPEELDKYITYYLDNLNERVQKADAGICFIRENYLYEQRAKVISKAIYELVAYKQKILIKR